MNWLWRHRDEAIPNLERIADHGPESVRHAALMECLGVGDYVHSHPGLSLTLSGADRLELVSAVSDKPLPSDLPMLLETYRGTDCTHALFAMRGLIKLNPPGLADLLHHCGNDSYMRAEADRALAKMGDSQAIARIIQCVRAQISSQWTCINFDEVCKSLARSGSPEATMVLAEASASKKEDVAIDALGGLAMLEVRAGLPDLRGLSCHATKWLDRIQAIQWLSDLKDAAAVDVLKESAADEDPKVARAASNALRHLQG